MSAPAKSEDDIDFDLGINGHNPIPPETVDIKALGELRTWQLRTLSNAYQKRPPRQYLVDGLLPLPSLSIVYGGPGSLKSMLLADLAAAIVAGDRWLEPLPGATGSGIVTLETTQAPILWIDFDNGTDRTDERMEAVAAARNLPESAPFYYVSMPMPWLDVSKTEMVKHLAAYIRMTGAKLVVIDNLGLVTGDTEENSARMAQVMGNLRWLCEETGTAVIVIHHQRKSSMGDKNVRKGEMLRGHSTIEASLDLALLVERKGSEDKIAIIPTKVRGYGQYEIIGARFTYEHRPGTKELAIARFFAEQPMTADEIANLRISNAIENLLRSRGSMNQRDIVNDVRDQMAAEPGGKPPSIHKIRGILKIMVDDGEIEESGNGSRRTYICIRKVF